MYFIIRYEAPKKLLSDQGREFINNMNFAVAEKFQIERMVTSAYHPQTNGLDERYELYEYVQLYIHHVVSINRQLCMSSEILNAFICHSQVTVKYSIRLLVIFKFHCQFSFLFAEWTKP